MLDLYRRHLPSCKYSSKGGQRYTKCSCPIWVYGTLPTQETVRKSLQTRDWTLALRRLNEADTDPTKISAGLKVSDAIKSYLEDCRSRSLAPSTIISYEGTLEPFVEFCQERSKNDLRRLSLGDFNDFRAARQSKVLTSSSQRKEIEHLRGFCAYCLDHDWIPKNFAKLVRPPKEDDSVTMPYTDMEVKALLVACDQITNNYEETAARARLRARALLLVMLYTGLRVSDALQVQRHQLDKLGRLRLRAMKSGVDMYIRLHPDCVTALEALPIEHPQYFFWSGNGRIESATGSARRTVDTISKISGVEARPHRFRDTFAVALLANGEDIRTVQLLLGHKSIRTTERHYAPFVKKFQDRLDTAVAGLQF